MRLNLSLNLSGDDWALSNMHVDTREILPPIQWRAVLMGKTWYGPTSRLSYTVGSILGLVSLDLTFMIQVSRLIDEDPLRSQ
jgi:hypothetical protein